MAKSEPRSPDVFRITNTPGVAPRSVELFFPEGWARRSVIDGGVPKAPKRRATAIHRGALESLMPGIEVTLGMMPKPEPGAAAGAATHAASTRRPDGQHLLWPAPNEKLGGACQCAACSRARLAQMATRRLPEGARPTPEPPFDPLAALPRCENCGEPFAPDGKLDRNCSKACQKAAEQRRRRARRSGEQRKRLTAAKRLVRRELEVHFAKPGACCSRRDPCDRAADLLEAIEGRAAGPRARVDYVADVEAAQEQQERIASGKVPLRRRG